MEKVPLATKISSVAILSLVATAGLWWLHIHSYSFVSAIDGAIGVVRAAGPLAYFTAMAFLPAIGCPLVAFYLPAAAAFSDQLGLAGVLLAAGLALLVNLAFSYWLACAALRPWFERLASGTKYKIPTITEPKAAAITFLVRVVQGPPFFLQSYLLALAHVPFWTYLWVSWLVAMVFATGYIVFGEAILSGKVQHALMGTSILAVIALLAQLIRRRYAR